MVRLQFNSVKIGALTGMLALGITQTAWAQSDEPPALDGPSEEAGSEVQDAPEPGNASEAEPAAPEEESEAGEGEAATPSDEGPAEHSSKAGADGARFRFGVSAGVGPLIGAGYSFTYFGADLRFGVQLNDALGIYVQPQLGYYTASDRSGVWGVGGLLGTSLLVDYTILDRFFVGGGFGYAVLNNPAGPEAHFRLGGYPLMGKSSKKVRRKGLMVGVDFRLHFVDSYTFVAPTFNIGYDAF